MALDFCFSEENKKDEFSIKDNELPLFEPSFYDLRDKTGIFIDPYGRTKIYPDHQKILVKFLEKNNNRRVADFITFLKKSIAHEALLLADGD